MANRLRIAVLAFIGITWSSLNVSAVEVTITKISSEEHVGQWAVEQVTGRIFASIPEKDEVAEFDPATGKLIEKYAPARRPDAFACQIALACRRLSQVQLGGNHRPEIEQGCRQRAIGGQRPNMPLWLDGRQPLRIRSLQYRRCLVGRRVLPGRLPRRVIRHRASLRESQLSMDVQHVAMSTDGGWIVVSAGPHLAQRRGPDERGRRFRHVQTYRASP